MCNHVAKKKKKKKKKFLCCGALKYLCAKPLASETALYMLVGILALYVRCVCV